MNIEELSEDPALEGALGGVERFAKAHGLSHKQAEKELQSVLSYTLHKPRRKRFPTLPTMVYGRDEQWQLDLVEMQKLSKWNKGMKYLLTVIDVFSKATWAEPIKNKGAKEMVNALNRIKKRLSPRRPLRVQTDKATEFYNAAVQAWFKKEGWDHFSTEGDSKVQNPAVRAQLYPAQTQTKTISYPAHHGVWARRAMAIRFGRNAKIEQMEQGYEVSVDGDRCVQQSHLGRAHQEQRGQRDGECPESHQETSFPTSSLEGADGQSH